MCGSACRVCTSSLLGGMGCRLSFPSTSPAASSLLWPSSLFDVVSRVGWDHMWRYLRREKEKEKEKEEEKEKEKEKEKGNMRAFPSDTGQFISF